MNLEQVTRRVHRYRYLNGLAEVTIGGLCLLGALLLLAARVLLDALSPTSFLPLVVGAGVIALFVAGSLALLNRMEWVRELFVYPRTGFVRYRQNDAEQRRFSRQFMLLAVALGALGSAYGDQLILVFGPLLACGLWYYARQTSIRRLYLEGALVYILAFALAIVRPIDASRITILYLALIGLCLCAAGLIAFQRYLHQSRVLES